MGKSFTLIRKFCRTVPLHWQATTAEMQSVKRLIIYSEGFAMIKSLFQAIEALLRAVIYLLILIIGLAITGLGAYVVIFFAIRIGQFLWVLILKEPWL
jgi:hypothetical protein